MALTEYRISPYGKSVYLCVYRLLLVTKASDNKVKRYHVISVQGKKVSTNLGGLIPVNEYTRVLCAVKVLNDLQQNVE